MSLATYDMQIAFNENVAGVFTVDGSALDGTDGLTDVGLFAGTFDDVTDDVSHDGYQIVFGTDNLMAAIQPATLTCKVARVDDPGFWNPNNPASPLNSDTPGFVPMRPVRLRATVGGNTYGVFRGFLRTATWNSQTRECEIHCEDLLLWASRVYPVIASTGPIQVGALVQLLFQHVDATVTAIVDPGILLDDFSADGSQSVTQILTNVLAVDLGTVYINGDGVPVYREHSYPLAANAAATVTITEQASEEQAGVDLDTIGTRATVEKLDSGGSVLGSWSKINADAEARFGRADIAAISSAYVQSGQTLADELVYEGVEGKPPLQFTLANVDDVTLLLMLQSQPLTVYTVDDPFGGSSGDGIAQRITHTIGPGGFHQAEFLCKARRSRAFSVDGSALDGTDGLRYP